jgi:hypothetical protein
MREYFEYIVPSKSYSKHSALMAEAKAQAQRATGKDGWELWSVDHFHETTVYDPDKKKNVSVEESIVVLSR